MNYRAKIHPAEIPNDVPDSVLIQVLTEDGRARKVLEPGDTIVEIRRDAGMPAPALNSSDIKIELEVMHPTDITARPSRPAGY